VHGSTKLDGLSFAVLLRHARPDGQGDWRSVSSWTKRASTEQREALTAIASGQGGGRWRRWGPLISHSKEPGEADQDRDERDAPLGLHPRGARHCRRGHLGAKQDEPIYLDNVGTPRARRLASPKPHVGHMHAFGIDWDDTSGRTRPLRAVRVELQLDRGADPAPSRTFTTRLAPAAQLADARWAWSIRRVGVRVGRGISVGDGDAADGLRACTQGSGRHRSRTDPHSECTGTRSVRSGSP